MFEFAVVARGAMISKREEERIFERYGERSILSDEDRLVTLRMFGGKSLLLARSRFEYQGDPVFVESGRFTCLNGYIVSRKFEGSSESIVEQIHALLLGSPDRSWVEEGLGEFQIVHYDGVSVEFIYSKAMTYPLYLREEAGGVGVSNSVS